MNDFRFYAATLLVGLVALTGSTANAATASRSDIINPAGACQPFAPTSQVRYSASGLRNAGTSQFYVACSTAGYYQIDATESNYVMTIGVSNTGSSDQSVACTARPGWTLGDAYNYQVASPKSTTLAPGAENEFVWTNSDFGDMPFRNANFTCTLKPGVEINFVFRRYYEGVGT